MGSPGGRWQTWLQEVVEFIAREGRLPTMYQVGEAETRLSSWLTRQQQQLRLGKLADERLQQLRDAHTLIRSRVQSWLDPDLEWRARLQELTEFLEREGRLPKGRQADKDESSLAQWLHEQRRFCHMKNLVPERVRQLREAHHLMETQVQSWLRPRPARVRRNSEGEAAWQETLQKLVEFVMQHGRIPTRCHADKVEFRLAAWLNTQQQSVRFGLCASDRLQQLRDSHPLIAGRAARWSETAS